MLGFLCFFFPYIYIFLNKTFVNFETSSELIGVAESFNFILSVVKANQIVG
jgi:hypothetical protein